eukprot:FR738170.1.p1 GENE.FR738170.1~~FR738170.1.p1  ORF type:complete len:306 (+),score=34.15 FR738170.1:3-920(+)
MDNEDDLNHVDRRGDTPLHAAACNGALLSLTHLLKLGTNPDVRNTKGYRPIDLAARRGHADCETVLSEYHMHHSAGSYFDSVLFLAALQGNKARHEAIDDDSEYEIMRKANPEATDDEIHRMWSMRRSQSMRLQQWASWIAYEDPKVGSVFWYNPRTQKSQWDKPEEVRTLQDSKQSSFKGEWEARKKTSMRLKRISDWIEYHGQGGKTFYYNETSREFQWERPVDLAPRENADQQEGQSAELPSDWFPYKDPNTGMGFWYNHTTHESQWEPPEGVADDQEAQDWDNQDGPEEVSEVHTLDELGI